MYKKGSTGMWLVAIVAVVAIIGLVILYSSLYGKGKTTATGQAYFSSPTPIRPIVTCTDADGDGYTNCAGDCNDADAGINPKSAENCDGKDNNCDGLVDGIYDVYGDARYYCPSCTETDGGDFPMTPGQATDTTSYPSYNSYTTKDTCKSYGTYATLVESYCIPKYGGSRTWTKEYNCHDLGGTSCYYVGGLARC